MENSSFSIESKKRYPLSRGVRIYNLFGGLLSIMIGSLQIIKVPYPMFNFCLIILGAFVLIYGLVGKDLFVTHNYIKIDASTIVLKNSLDSKDIINLEPITYIRIKTFGLEITIDGHVKNLNLSWMTPDEFQRLRLKLEGLSNQKKIIMD